MLHRIFVNYRAADSRESASAIARDLKSLLGDESVFIDHAMRGGDCWPQRLRDEVDSATGMLCVIGPRWLDELEARSRQPAEQDWVRCEIRRALERGIPVIPILVNGGVRPKKESLPEDLQELADRQDKPLRATNWESDRNRIVRDLGIRPADFQNSTAAKAKGYQSSLRRSDIREYLKGLVDQLRRDNAIVKSQTFLEPTVDERSSDNPKKDEPSWGRNYPRGGGSILSLYSAITPAIEEVVRGTQAERITSAPDVIGLQTRTIRNAMSLLQRGVEPIVLMGEPGSGKSTVLRELGIRLANRASLVPGAAIPVFIELGSFRSAIDHYPQRAILDLVRNSIPPRFASIRSYIGDDDFYWRFVLLFDGMDEIPRTGDYPLRTQALAGFADDFALVTRSVFACRTNDFDSSFGHRQLVLRPFDRGQIKKFVRCSLGGEIEIDGAMVSPNDVALRLMRADELGGEAGNPLTLSMATEFIGANKTWPRGRAALFSNHLVALAATAAHRSGVRRPTAEALNTMVNEWASLAFSIFRAEAAVFISRDELIEKHSESAVRSASEGGLLHVDRESGLIKFTHHRLQEFLVSWRLRLPDPPQVDWAKLISSPRWQETLLNFFVLGGHDDKTLEVILETIRPAERFFQRLRPIVEKSHALVEKRRAESERIKPDTRERAPGSQGGFADAYSTRQQKLKDHAEMILKQTLDRHRTLTRLPPDRESRWSDYLLFAARASAVVPPTAHSRDELRRAIERGMSGLFEFGRPWAQVRMLLAWKEVSSWCPRAILQPARHSKVGWVRSHAIHAVLSTPLSEGKANDSFAEELEWETINFRLPSQFSLFWRTSSLQTNRRWLLLLASVFHSLFVLSLVGFVFGLSFLVVRYSAFAPFWLPDLGSFGLWCIWLLALTTVIVLTVPVCSWNLVTRLAAVNGFCSGGVLAYLLSRSWTEAGMLTPGWEGWALAMGLVAMAAFTALANLSVFVFVAWLARACFAGYFPAHKRFDRRLAESECIRSAKLVAKPSLRIAGILSLFATLSFFPELKTLVTILNIVALWVGMLLAFVFVATIVAAVVWLLALPLIAIYGRWMHYSNLRFAGRLRKVCVEVVAMTSRILVVGMAAAAIMATVWMIGSRLLPIFELLEKGFIAVILSIGGLAIVVSVIAYIVFAFASSYADLRYQLFRSRFQGRPFRGTLEEWKKRFADGSPRDRRDLLELFNHHTMGVSPEDALAVLLKLENYVEDDSLEADRFHHAIAQLQDVIRQQRWEDVGQPSRTGDD